MKHNFNRRDFLKLSGLLPLGLAAPQLMRNPGISQLPQGQKNILIIIFDAFSAYNISLYGYPVKPHQISIGWQNAQPSITTTLLAATILQQALHLS